MGIFDRFRRGPSAAKIPWWASAFGDRAAYDAFVDTIHERAQRAGLPVDIPAIESGSILLPLGGRRPEEVVLQELAESCSQLASEEWPAQIDLFLRGGPDPTVPSRKAQRVHWPAASHGEIDNARSTLDVGALIAASVWRSDGLGKLSDGGIEIAARQVVVHDSGPPARWRLTDLISLVPFTAPATMWVPLQKTHVAALGVPLRVLLALGIENLAYATASIEPDRRRAMEATEQGALMAALMTAPDPVVSEDVPVSPGTTARSLRVRGIAAMAPLFAQKGGAPHPPCVVAMPTRDELLVMSGGASLPAGTLDGLHKLAIGRCVGAAALAADLMVWFHDECWVVPAGADGRLATSSLPDPLRSYLGV